MEGNQIEDLGPQSIAEQESLGRTPILRQGRRVFYKSSLCAAGSRKYDKTLKSFRTALGGLQFEGQGSEPCVDPHSRRGFLEGSLDGYCGATGQPAPADFESLRSPSATPLGYPDISATFAICSVHVTTFTNSGKLTGMGMPSLRTR